MATNKEHAAVDEKCSMHAHTGRKHLEDFITACNYDPVKSTMWQSITTHAHVDTWCANP